MHVGEAVVAVDGEEGQEGDIMLVCLLFKGGEKKGKKRGEEEEREK
jgi:hypothetical protein